jgi:hypothetical protein
MKEIPTDLSVKEVNYAIIEKLKSIPENYRLSVFNNLLHRYLRYDFANYGLWHRYIRELSNGGFLL